MQTTTNIMVADGFFRQFRVLKRQSVYRVDERLCPPTKLQRVDGTTMKYDVRMHDFRTQSVPGVGATAMHVSPTLTKQTSSQLYCKSGDEKKSIGFESER